MNWTGIFRARGRGAPARASRPALRVERLEERDVPAVIGTPFAANAFGGGNLVPFPGFAGSVRVASGDVNRDGVPDIITATGPGAGTNGEVRIFDGAAARNTSQAVLIADFFTYPGFSGGVYVASADFNGDGFAEVVTVAGGGGQGHVKVFDFNSGGFLGSAPLLRTSFVSYPGYLGDVQVATLTRSGQVPLLVTASGAGSTSTDLRAYANPFAIGGVPLGTFVTPVAQTFAFPGYLGGVTIGSGGTSFSAPQQLIVSTNAGPSTLGAFNLASTGSGGFFFAPGPQFQAGTVFQNDTRTAVADINRDGVAEVVTTSVGPNGAGPVSAFTFNGSAFTPAFTSALFGFQGFGFFNGTWLSAATLGLTTPATIASTFTTPTTAALFTPGLTTGMTGGLVGATPGSTFGATGASLTNTMATTPETNPAFFGTSASTNLSRGVI
jgi:hypothetical protein